MKLMAALKKFFEEEPHGKKCELSELTEFKRAISDGDREEYRAFLSKHFGEEIEA